MLEVLPRFMVSLSPFPPVLGREVGGEATGTQYDRLKKISSTSANFGARPFILPKVNTRWGFVMVIGWRTTTFPFPGFALRC